MKLRKTITCPYCQAPARPANDGPARDPQKVRYACDNGHKFAVFKSSVEVK